MAYDSQNRFQQAGAGVRSGESTRDAPALAGHRDLSPMRSVLVNSLFNSGKQVVAILVAFLVTPVIVRSLGNELYGTWSLIVSITGYYSFLEFGVAGAVVKYISEYVARGDRQRTQSVFTTASFFFGAVGLFALFASLLIGFFFDSWFDLTGSGAQAIFPIVLLMGANMAINMGCSSLNASLFATQEIPALATIDALTNIFRNLLLVVLLMQGHGLLMMALVTISLSIPRVVALRLVLRLRQPAIRLRVSTYARATLRLILTYSFYSFVIAIASKLMYYSSSVIIGKMISMTEVTFYAIVASLLVYLETVIWSMQQVLIPVISSQDAKGDVSGNRWLYDVGVRYSLALTLPVTVSLFAVGEVFIANWMGPEYAARGALVLKILAVGYTFQFAQFPAHAVLKAINRHRFLALLLTVQAAVSVLLSLLLVPRYGIEGVALGTTVPLVIMNLVFIPAHTCRVLRAGFLDSLRRTIPAPLLTVALFAFLHYLIKPAVETYLDVVLYAAVATTYFGAASWLFVIEPGHRQQLLAALRRLWPPATRGNG